MTSITIEGQFKNTGGRPSGFDYLRILLSVAVIGYHTIVVCYGKDFDLPLWGANQPFRPLLAWVIPSFFALSGFLVAGSLYRNTLPGFLALRAARIFPALCCEVFISALIIGPVLTSFTLGQYFSDKVFYNYFLNIIGSIHYELPGMFLNNPFPDKVNMQLWTIPYELQCYIALTVLAAFRVVQKPRLFVLAFVAATVFAYGYSAWWAGFDQTHWGPSGRVCVLSFLSGVLIYMWRDKMPYSTLIAGACVAVSWLLLRRMETEYFAAFPVAYVTVWAGLKNPKKIFLIAGADYSYGMYLYGYPVQQAMMQLFPFGHAWYANLILSLAGSGLAAYLSWNFIESKILDRKKIPVNFANATYDRCMAIAGPKTPRFLPRLFSGLVDLGDRINGLLERVG